MARKNKRTTMEKLSLGVAAIGLFLIGFALWSFLNTSKPQSAAPTSPHSEEDNLPEVERVSLEDARMALDSGSAVFVDVRDAFDYAEAHIPEALSIPLAQLDDQVTELNPSDWIITYCT
jgi:3-mercaptopyruvate sulfurtransferase SseA